ncbi:hypothetical protein CB0940_06911 [Cercospora beticola]|uniref:Uncharacterized protein n=1 Tax=Cercospora beticola TaxID=122368 RepID=A0A2G5H8N9_CERBT|nr:hypothetical protein CB0940_06911 [Cercospora beticola]PIA88673.1 hypothetical protein CB0940_06911 [Cercospora beticola]WPB02829.1 hypothetical protein RHO25_007465 [Cercospora beticola]CAK1358478.1 unnamed protein product [Cercospora beticola]
MQFQLSVLALAAFSFINAYPFDEQSQASDILGRAPIGVGIGYGEELQSDSVNHWVAWIEGRSACPAVRILGSLQGNACNQVFNIDGQDYKFGDCGSDGNPRSLLDGSGNYLRGCKGDSDKIHCHGSQHDIKKHGKCV